MRPEQVYETLRLHGYLGRYDDNEVDYALVFADLMCQLADELERNWLSLESYPDRIRRHAVEMGGHEWASKA